MDNVKEKVENIIKLSNITPPDLTGPSMVFEVERFSHAITQIWVIANEALALLKQPPALPKPSECEAAFNAGRLNALQWAVDKAEAVKLSGNYYLTRVISEEIIKAEIKKMITTQIKSTTLKKNGEYFK